MRNRSLGYERVYLPDTPFHIQREKIMTNVLTGGNEGENTHQKYNNGSILQTKYMEK